jgi:hypothetical protein
MTSTQDSYPSFASEVQSQAPACHAMSAVGLPPFYFIVTFWGARYREWFCRFALPSLLAPNNIPALQHLKKCRFLICTTRKDWARLQREPIFVLLKQYIAPIFLESRPSPLSEHKYSRMSRGHVALTVACHEARACAIYFAPDTVVPDGCVAAAQRLWMEGRRVVLCTAIRFDMDGVEAELSSRGLLKPGLPLVLSRRDAVDIGLRNLHPESRAGNWDESNFGSLSTEHGRTDFPVCCYWEVQREKGVVIHTHNWAPFLMDFSSLAVHNTEALQKWAIDGDYIHHNFGQAKLGEAVYVVDDSDDIILLGLTPRHEMVPPRRHGLLKSIPILGEWTKGYLVNQVVFDRYTDPLRRKIYSTCVRWHSRDLTPAWAAVEARARKIMADYTPCDLRPRSQIAGLGSSRDFIRFFFSPRILAFFWFVLVFWVFLSVQRLISRFVAVVGSYAHPLWAACMGDPVEQARIRGSLTVMTLATQYTVHPKVQIAGLKSSQDVMDFILSPRVLGLLWYVSVYWMYLSVRRFTDHWFPRLRSYSFAIRWAWKGDPVQQARIRNRVRLIVSIFSKT